MAFDGSLKFDTAVDSKGFQGGIDKIGSLAADGCKAVAGAFAAAYAAAGAAVAGLTKTAIENYADYEQLVGGVETLFKDSADTVMGYANAAFETAGLSANAYMETVTSFSASLLQSLGGDTEKAAEKANMAIVDMSDNANKMGTDMASIQNAYQGFAKQNYTMLDNLKLGYGGTKEEMQRLLTEAQKISGIKYDISSYSDIVDAIHVIQTEMHISGISAEEAAEAVASGAMTEEEAFEAMGTTAKEASTTIQGSMNAAKSAWTNWVTGLADDSQDFGQLTENLVNSVVTAGENIIPRIEETLPNVVNGLSVLISTAVDMLPDLLPKFAKMGADAIGAVTSALRNADGLADAIAQMGIILIDSAVELLPEFVNIGISLMESLIGALLDNIDAIVDAAIQIGMALIASFIQVIPELIVAGIEIITALIDGIAQSLPELIPAAKEGVMTILQAIRDNIQTILAAGIEILIALIDGITEMIPELIPVAVECIFAIVDGLLENLPELLTAAIQIILALALGLIDAIPDLIAYIPEIVSSIAEAIIDNLPLLITACFEIMLAIGNGLLDCIGQLTQNIPEILNKLKDEFLDHDWSEIGSNIIDGIKNGLVNAGKHLWEGAKETVTGLVDGITDFFGIHSPSTLMRDRVGVNIASGIGIGFEDEMGNVTEDAVAAMDDMVATVNGDIAAAYRPQYGDVISDDHSRSSSVVQTDNTYNIYTQASSAQDAREIAEELARIKSQEDAAKGE